MADSNFASDVHELFKITYNPDGTLTREGPFPTVPATPELTTDSQLALSKDVTLNPTNNTFLRLFRPVTITGKLPVILYFHGGGFILCSATSSVFHQLTSSMSTHSPAIVISVEYRLAPEHRLPAAYDDAVEALLWVRDQALGINGCDEWLIDVADFSKVYLVGGSAGGNIVYNTGVRALDLDLNPIKIAGLVIDQAFFGGVERTKSELRLENDRIVPIKSTDIQWSLALPKGSDRDHEYSNPTKDQNKPPAEKIKRLPKCFVRGFYGDPMIDRQIEFANMLESCGVQVIKKFEDEGYHGVEIYDSKAAQVMYDDLKRFIWSS